MAEDKKTTPVTTTEAKDTVKTPSTQAETTKPEVSTNGQKADTANVNSNAASAETTEATATTESSVKLAAEAIINDAVEADKQIQQQKKDAEDTGAAINKAVADGETVTYRVIRVGNVMSYHPDAEVVETGLSFQEANEKIKGDLGLYIEPEMEVE